MGWWGELDGVDVGRGDDRQPVYGVAGADGGRVWPSASTPSCSPAPTALCAGLIAGKCRAGPRWAAAHTSALHITARIVTSMLFVRAVERCAVSRRLRAASRARNHSIPDARPWSSLWGRRFCDEGTVLRKPWVGRLDSHLWRAGTGASDAVDRDRQCISKQQAIGVSAYYLSEILPFFCATHQLTP